jgi:hypothetical protein
MARRGNQERKQELTIAALLTERTIEDAAAKVGVAFRTLKRWLADPGFLTAYRDARRRVVEAVVGQLQAASAKAVQALVVNLECESPAARNTAARVILEMAVKGVELADVLQRLEALERADNERGH